MAIVNCILGKTTEKIIGIKHWGGEISQTYGFGISLTKFYPLSTPEEQIDYPARVGFAPLNFILTVLVLFAICFIILFLNFIFFSFPHIHRKHAVPVTIKQQFPHTGQTQNCESNIWIHYFLHNARTTSLYRWDFVLMSSSVTP